jgi:hypothetical protein
MFSFKKYIFHGKHYCIFMSFEFSLRGRLLVVKDTWEGQCLSSCLSAAPSLEQAAQLVLGSYDSSRLQWEALTAALLLFSLNTSR